MKARLSPGEAAIGAAALILMGSVMVLFGLVSLFVALIATPVAVWDSIRRRT